MAGICYNKSGTMISMTGPEYTGVSIPSGAKTLYIRTGTNVSDKIAYGLTTDVSASEYSPSINVSGTTMYIASGGTVTETVTTGTVYHTATRASTSATNFKVATKSTKAAVSTMRVMISGNPQYVSNYTCGLSNATQLYNNKTITCTYKYKVVTSRTIYSSYTLQSYTYTNQNSSRNWRPAIDVVTSTADNITQLATFKNSLDTVSASYLNLTYPICQSFSITVTGYSSQSKRIILYKGGVLTNVANSYSIITAVSTNQYDYETCSSTYTSRTEYLTSSRTYTTNNIAV